jgi:drug/metabolite transporter (DMT)-like permease
MKKADALVMLLLAAIWGASFLFLRVASPAVGPVAVSAIRVTGAALILLPLVHFKGQMGALRGYGPTLLVAAILSCVLPFLGLSKAAQLMPAGPLSVLNATTPMWGALVGWLWSGEKLGAQRLAGLVLGMAGVAWLAEQRNGLGGEFHGLAVALALGSTFMYAVAVHHSKKYLSGLPSLAVSGGLLGASALMLLGPALWLGPVPAHASTLAPVHWGDVHGVVWGAMAGLALMCTGLAYVLFYRLIDRIGASRALTVTFLIPPFGMLWGALWLDEAVTLPMLICTAVIVMGTVLSTQTVPWPFSPAGKLAHGMASALPPTDR